MSFPVLPPNAPSPTEVLDIAEDLPVPAIDPDVAGAAAALDGVPPCPDIAGVILEQFPDIKVVVDLLAVGIGAAEGIYAKTLTQDPTSLTNQAKSAFTDAETKAKQAVINAARDLKKAAEEIAAEAKQAVLDELDKIGELYEAIAQGVLDIGTSIENLDETAIAAMEAQFPGFKSAIECLKGGPEGSPVREAAGDGAKAQITTPAPLNPAAERGPYGEFYPRGRNPRAGYPHVFADLENIGEIWYGVYPGLNLYESNSQLYIKKFGPSSHGTARELGATTVLKESFFDRETKIGDYDPTFLNKLQEMYPNTKFEDLQRITIPQRLPTVDAGEPEQPIPESSES